MIPDDQPNLNIDGREIGGAQIVQQNISDRRRRFGVNQVGPGIDSGAIGRNSHLLLEFI